jgi:hypothetical protein
MEDTQECVGYGMSDAVPVSNTDGPSPTQIFTMLGNNSNENSLTGVAVPATVTAPVPALAAVGLSQIRWPPISKLMSNPQHNDVVLRILSAVDECNCTRETQAKDKSEPKANAWARLLDNLYGGGGIGRGLLGNAGFRPFTKPTQCKKKITEMWAYALKNEDSVTGEVFVKCKRQAEEYNLSVEEEKNSRDKDKVEQQKLQEEMKEYQRGIGAIPPGAKGREGGGRVQHSTNTRLGQPATFIYASGNTSNGERTLPAVAAAPSPSSTITNSLQGATSRNVSARSSRSSSPFTTPGSRKSTVTVNTGVAERINAMTENFRMAAANLNLPGFASGGAPPKPLTARARVTKRLSKKSDRLKQSAEFYKSQGEAFREEFMAAMTEYKATNDLINSYLDESDEDDQLGSVGDF